MSANQSSLPLAGSPFGFRQHGKGGAWLSELLPHTAKVADELCVVRSMYTEAINHGPGVTYLQTGSQFPGRPSMGAWLNYGLGVENQNLPSFVVLVTKGKGGQPLVSRLWGSGFLPSRHQGVRFRSDKNPVLYLSNPDGIDKQSRRKMLDRQNELHQRQLQRESDPEIETRIAQYELAFRMQSSIPDVVDMSDEPQFVFDQYGEDAKKPGTFAANCLLARRLAERGVRFIQLYHPGWDQHGGLVGGLTQQCRETDQACAALIADLRTRGLLDDTLVIWGGEFGRTNYCQGKLEGTKFGRDHHPRCFSIWMAGGGIRPGMTYGATDEYGYNIVENGVSRARLPRDDPAPTGHRPRTSNVQTSGKTLPFNGCARKTLLCRFWFDGSLRPVRDMIQLDSTGKQGKHQSRFGVESDEVVNGQRWIQ